MSDHYLGIAERIHADACVTAGVCVLGLSGPSGVKKLNPGDGVIYYSPKTAPDGEVLRAFTAIGEVTGETPYERSFEGASQPLWVRDVAWRREAREVSIYDLLEQLSWIRNPKNWGFYMRGSHRAIPAEDYARIAGAMLGGAA